MSANWHPRVVRSGAAAGHFGRRTDRFLTDKNYPTSRRPPGQAVGKISQSFQLCYPPD